NDFIELRPVDKVIVNRIGDFGTDIHHMNEAVVDPSARRVVPENSVTVGREQHGHSNVRVLLRQIHRLAVVIPDSSLVLSQSIKSFASSIHIGYSLSPVRFFAVYRLRSHDSPAIVEEPLFGGSREGYPAILFPHRNGQRSSRNRHFL